VVAVAQIIRNIFQEVLVKIQVLELSLPMAEVLEQDILTALQGQVLLLKFLHMLITDFVAAMEVVVEVPKANGQVREKVYREKVC
jgi:hypothetical protein